MGSRWKVIRDLRRVPTAAYLFANDVSIGRGVDMGAYVVFQLFFAVCAAVLFYVYVGYPAVLAFLAHFAKGTAPTPDAGNLTVTLLISAYNESQVIASKMDNSLALDYPKDRLEVLVISDGSEDGTDAIVERYIQLGVRLVRQQPRMGKTAGLNLGVSQARGQILVFSDANALYQPDAIRQLVRHFSNPNVGYVVGNARYYEKGATSPSAASEGLYWKLETFLKKQGSRFGSVVGGDGAIYAIRREFYSLLLPTDINDFLNPLQIIARGYLGLFEPAAVCYEEAADNFSQEFRRKVRIISRSLNALRRIPEVLNPFKNTRHWFMLVSHKVLRWFAPVFMILLFGVSLTLWRYPFYRFAALLQIAFYAMALVGWRWQTENRLGGVFSLPFYFCMVNLASLIGCSKCLRGDLVGQWAPPRHKIQDHV
jgi:cellulose synthase/poly-beta-1,6-N-acetylglucosamine synthase-like glycosyltransferase